MRNAKKRLSYVTNESDQDLLERCIREERGAFEKLVKRHQVRLFRAAYRIMKDRDLASELVQESLFRAYKNLRKHDGRGSVAGWLTKITVNTCLNEVRKRKRLVFSEHPMDAWVPTRESEGPQARAEASELRQAVKREVEKLTPRRQAVLALAALSYSYDEMAEALGESVTQIKSELFRARKHLRETLKEQRSS